MAGGFVSTLCGQGPGWNEQIVDIQVVTDHALSTATLMVTSNLNEVGINESWGVRDIQIITKEVKNIDVQQEIKENALLFY